MVRKGEIFRVHRGIYASTEDPQEWARALALGLSGVVFTGRTAWELHNGAALTFPLEAEGPRTIRGPRFRVRHSRLRSRTMVRGLPVVEPLWAVRSTKEVMDPVIERHYAGWQGPARLKQDLRRMRRIPGRLKSTLQRCAIGADSKPEVTLSRALARRGFRVRHNRTVGGYRFDLEVKGVLIEIDGYEFHSKHRQFVIDRVKSNAATILGRTVLRFTADCVDFHLDAVVDLIEYATLADASLKPRPLALLPAWEWHACV